MLRAMVRVIALGMLVAPADAADIPKLSASSPLKPTSLSWGGLYAGLNLGWGAGRFQWDSTPTFAGLVAGGTKAPNHPTAPFSTSRKSESLLGGGQVGYQWQLSKTILGIEADFQRTGDNTGRFVPLDPPPPTISTLANTGSSTDLLSARVNYSASLRARVGYSIQERTLIYATGGVAFANLKAVGSYLYRGGIGSPAASYGGTATLTGWTAGIGVDYSLTDQWFLGAEYRYTDYGYRSFQLGSVTNTPSGRIWRINNMIGLTSSTAVLKLNRQF